MDLHQHQLIDYRFITNNRILPLILEVKEQFIPWMMPYWKTYPAVYLYYLKNAGKAKRVKVLIDFLIMKTTQ